MEDPVQAKVNFQDAIDSLGNGILVWISIFRQANGDAGLSQLLHVLETAVLTSPVRVMHKLLAIFALA
ncbi:hypothetical protein SAMN04488069_110136 [Hymenobacter psychrophilus]|uniref:Uncharacterized protein n=1 Tax=Hymenobacter psychrophilus TaxID=651662 RepID=A0A1H3L771_9BACT|nr:hypothetical protein SAMN04488069_110136 [Hymenobacter psychrophilus]